MHVLIKRLCFVAKTTTVASSEQQTEVQLVAESSGVRHDDCEHEIEKQAVKVPAATVPRGRKFQPSWLKPFPWLQYFEFDSQPTEANDAAKAASSSSYVLCRVCRECEDKKLFKFSTKKEQTFISDGFSNWKKALQKFKKHERSECHREAALKTAELHKGTNVTGQLNSQTEQERQTAKVALMKIITSVRFLARQNLALRGHTDDNSNLTQLVNLRADDCHEFRQWLHNKYKWLSHDVQNELLEILALSVLRKVLVSVRSHKYYAIMADETTDISISQQMSICFRSVDDQLTIHENFVGFYEPPSADAATLYKTICDVLIRCEIDIADCRGQCFDGASTMSGVINGVQAKILSVSPSAYFVHCNAHNLNLAFQDGVSELTNCRDALSLVKEIVTCLRESPKRLAFFTSLQEKTSPGLRPLCPTRWTMRISSVSALLVNYSSLTEFLIEQQTARSDYGAKCSGFLRQLLDFRMFFTLHCLHLVFGRLETTAKALQSPSLSMADVSDLMSTVLLVLEQLRTDDKFNDFWKDVQSASEVYDIDAPELPRKRKRPRRYDDAVTDHDEYQDVKQYYRKQFFEVIDVTIAALKSRFDSPGFTAVVKLESTILRAATVRDTADADVDYICGLYPELSRERLKLHFDMFRDVCSQKQLCISNVQDMIKTFQSSETGLCQLLPELLKVLKLFLTIPVTTCTAERSFSHLRRIKTYLRSTIGQSRLNHIAILSCYLEETDIINIHDVYTEFVSRNELRRKTFAA